MAQDLDPGGIVRRRNPGRGCRLLRPGRGAACDRLHGFVTVGVAWCAVALLPGQDARPDAAAKPPRTITIQNLTPYPREEWFAVPVPFARGEVPGVPALHVQDRHTVWQPFGARWPDGSLRQALCLFRASIGQNSEATLPLAAGRGPVGARPIWPKLDYTVDVAVTQNGQDVRVRPRQVEVLEDNAARRVVLSRCRVGKTGLVIELIVEHHAGQEHAWVDVAVFFSDPTSKAMQCKVDQVAVECRGRALVIRHAPMLAVREQMTEGGSRTVLLADQVLGDGQGIRRTGVLVPALRGDRSPRDATILAAIAFPPLGATRWSESGAFGPFGFVPEPPPWLAGRALRSAFAKRHLAFVRESRRQAADPFRRFPWGLAKYPGQTGDQPDFGVVKLESVAATGVPSFLLEVEPSVLQEACRPVHNFEVDGSPVLARKHPDWVVWSGRSHWNAKVSVDRLGKPPDAPRLETHEWKGKDRQHWSNLYLASYYLLTGKHWALRELQNEVQLYLAAQTLDPKLSTSTTGAPRGAGRVLLSASWMYLCTGDAKLLERMRARIEGIHAVQWAGAKTQMGKVRPFGVMKPDRRIFAGAGRYWVPWQDSLAAIGLAAAHRVTGSEQALAVADEVALNCLRYGWRVEGAAVPTVAYAMRWKDGAEPPTAAELRGNDSPNVNWSRGTGFSVWSIGAVELARQAAERRGDDALAARASGILKALRATRRPPEDGWFDRFGQWDAVR